MGLPDRLVFQDHPGIRIFVCDLKISHLCISSPDSKRMPKHTSGLYAEPASGTPRGAPLTSKYRGGELMVVGLSRIFLRM